MSPQPADRPTIVALVDDLEATIALIEERQLVPYATKGEVAAIASQLLLAESVDLLRAAVEDR